MQMDLLQSLTLLSGLITVYGAGIYMMMDILLFHFFTEIGFPNNETSPTVRVGYNNTFLQKSHFRQKWTYYSLAFQGRNFLKIEIFPGFRLMSNFLWAGGNNFLLII